MEIDRINYDFYINCFFLLQNFWILLVFAPPLFPLPNCLPFFHILTKIDLCTKFNLKKIKIKDRRYTSYREKKKTIFSWGEKIKFSIEDIIFDFGIINPTPIDLTKDFQMLNVVKYFDRYH